jgi:hypothetical protein
MDASDRYSATSELEGILYSGFKSSVPLISESGVLRNACDQELSEGKVILMQNYSHGLPRSTSSRSVVAGWLAR